MLTSSQSFDKLSSPQNATSERITFISEPPVPRKEPAITTSPESVLFCIRTQLERPASSLPASRQEETHQSLANTGQQVTPRPETMQLLPIIEETGTAETEFTKKQQSRRSHLSRSQPSDNSAEELPHNIASNLPNAALLEQIKAMINRAITA